MVELSVLLIEHDAHLGELFHSVPEDEGFGVDLVLVPDDVVAGVTRLKPSLLELYEGGPARFRG